MDICPNCYGMKEWQGQDCPMCWVKGVIEQGVEEVPDRDWANVALVSILLVLIFVEVVLL